MNTSKGEMKIIKLLKAEKIYFIREYIFHDLKSLKGGKPRFDFLIKENNEIAYIIEVDGEQHFKQVKIFSKHQHNFQYLQYCDMEKNKYCLINNIPLYRIPYYDIDKINSVADIKQDKYLVKDKNHNYNIAHNLKK